MSYIGQPKKGFSVVAYNQQKLKGPPMTHKQELEMRLNDLQLKLAEERACLSPVQLYIDDLQLTIGYVERQIKFIFRTEAKHAAETQ